MKLEKDGQIINLENENHITAFLESGWVESSEEEKPKKKKKQEK